MERPISKIAQEIKDDWKNPYFAAKPHLQAMFSLQKTSDMYGQDFGYSIVCYFLANASTWRGEIARRIKKELKLLANLK